MDWLMISKMSVSSVTMLRTVVFFANFPKNGISIGNTVLSEASAEALIIAVAAMIEENNKALLSEIS